MKHKFISRLTGCLLVTSLLLTGCTKGFSPDKAADDTEQPTVSTDDTDISEPRKDIRYLSYNKEYTTDTDQSLLSLSYSYPFLTLPGQEQAADNINRFFESDLEDFKAFGHDTLLPEATAFCQENSADFSSYDSCRYYELMRCDNRLISFLYTNSNYYGYNGSDYSLQGISFDGTTGEALSLTDLTSDMDAFSDSVLSYILNQLKRPYYTDDLKYAPSDCADLIRQEVLVDGNWYVSSAGICIIVPAGLLTNSEWQNLQFTIPYQQLNGLAVAYEYDGPFEMVGPLGTTLTADIDSNGDADAIYFDAAYDEESYSIRATLTVNGDNYSHLLNNDTCMLTDGATYGLDYYLIDLDTSDPYIELAIQDNGMSDDPITYFFRYKDFQLEYMGYICDLISSSSFRWDGSGTFTCDMPLNLMLTTNVTSTYEVRKDQIRPVKQDWYELDLSLIPQDMQSNAILESFTAYTEMNRRSETITLSPSDGAVKFTGTDNEHWVSFLTESGETYYLYLTDFSTLESGQYTYDVFDTLYLVG